MADDLCHMIGVKELDRCDKVIVVFHFDAAIEFVHIFLSNSFGRKLLLGLFKIFAREATNLHSIVSECRYDRIKLHRKPLRVPHVMAIDA